MRQSSQLVSDPLPTVPSGFDPYNLTQPGPNDQIPYEHGGNVRTAAGPSDATLYPKATAVGREDYNAPLPEPPKGFDPYMMDGRQPNSAEWEAKNKNQCGPVTCIIA